MLGLYLLLKADEPLFGTGKKKDPDSEPNSGYWKVVVLALAIYFGYLYWVQILCTISAIGAVYTLHRYLK